jgi:branched-chain amino acid transport system permease protein
MTNILDILFNGAAMGSIYALIALGFVLIFKSTGLLNFAQGELCMVGAFICYNFATLLHVPYLLSFLIAIGLGALLGTLIEVLFFRRMVGEPIYSTIIVTLGLASILTCLTGLMWGHDVYSLRSPFMDKTVAVGNMVFSHAALYTIGVSVLLFGLFILFFNRSLLGIALKGTAEDSDAAAGLMGINVKRMACCMDHRNNRSGCGRCLSAEQSLSKPHAPHRNQGDVCAILGGWKALVGNPRGFYRWYC